jgi:predicted DNA-binding WGR domain protein
MRHFEMADDKHSKFWEIEIEDTDVITRYGRIDTVGQRTIKSYGSCGEANEQAAKLITSKIKKGYVEVY